MKKLSIITICYNDPNLENTCKSIVEQTWQDFEWIVVDGGSNEEIQKIWNKYKYRIDQFISEPDKGVYDAQNKGINLASGEYLNFLNSGDSYFDRNILSDIFKNTKHTEDLLYGDIYRTYNDFPEKNSYRKYKEKLNKKFFIPYNLNTQAIFVKRDLFEKYGMYNTTYKIVADLDRWLDFYEHNAKFKYLNRVIVNYDMTGLSSSNGNQELHKKEKMNVLSKYFTQKEIEKEYKNKNKPSYKFFERIFSVKNTKDKKYKILTILGILIKIKKS